MKRFCWIIGLMLFIPLVVAQAGPMPTPWLTLSPGGSRIELFKPDHTSANAYQVGSKPFALNALPGQDGYALLYLGAKSFLGGVKEPGGIAYLNGNLQPTGKKLSFSGLALHEFYREDLATWFVFTAESSGFKEKNHNLTVINLKEGALREIPLASAPAFYKMIDPAQLAIATYGETQTPNNPQLILVDLTDWTTTSYSLSANPGALFVINPDQLLVACGGSKPSAILNLGDSDAASPEPATLHLIDRRQQTIKKIPVGYGPLAIVQDRLQSDTFYLTSSPKFKPTDPAGLIQVVTGDEITASLQIDANPISITQAATGNLCVLGRQEFFLIDPAAVRIIRKSSYDLKPEELLLNEAETIGYLTNVNSNYMEVIDLADGNLLAKVQLGKSTLLSGFRLSKLLPSSYPPVIGMPEKLEPVAAGTPTNRRMVMDAAANRLFVLVGTSEVAVIDLASNQVKQSIRLNGAAYGLHLTPNRKYLAVPTETNWYLLDPDSSDPVVLRMLITNDEDLYAPEIGYYSPDGKLLVVPFENSLHLVDTDHGRLLGKTRSKTLNPLIVWP